MRGLKLLAALLLMLPAMVLAQHGPANAKNAKHVAAANGSGSYDGGPTADQRQLVKVSEPERLLLLHNMADMMANVSGILDGLASDNRKAVAKAASANGVAMMNSLPSSLTGKFPKGFAQMAQSSHKAFDQIAAEATNAKSSKPILKHLAAALQTCVTCHAAYRFGSNH